MSTRMRASVAVVILLFCSAGFIFWGISLTMVALAEDANAMLAVSLALEFAVLTLFLAKAIEAVTVSIDVSRIQCVELAFSPHVLRRVSINWCDVTSVVNEGYVLRIDSKSARFRLNLGLFWDMDGAVAFVRRQLPADVRWKDAVLKKT